MFDSLLNDYPILDRAIEAIGATPEEALETDTIVIRITLAALIGLILGQVYRHTFTGRRFSPTLPDTHVLLCMGGALIWLVVGNNLVRAFGLAGTIGLIRYRTVVRDPKDTTILLFSMIMGMACGLGQLVVAIVGTCMIIVVLVILNYRHRQRVRKQAQQSADLLDLLKEGDEAPPSDSRSP